MNRGVAENDRVPWPLNQWRWQLADDTIDMRYTYASIDTRRFTYQFLGELFRVRAIYGTLPGKLLKYLQPINQKHEW